MKLCSEFPCTQTKSIELPWRSMFISWSRVTMRMPSSQKKIRSPCRLKMSITQPPIVFSSYSISICSLHQTGVSKNSGTPKSSILIGCSIINHPFWGTPIFGNTQTTKHNHGHLCFSIAEGVLHRSVARLDTLAFVKCLTGTTNASSTLVFVVLFVIFIESPFEKITIQVSEIEIEEHDCNIAITS